jgi:hypothetical protein
MTREDKLEIARMAYKEIMLSLKSVSIYKDVEVNFYYFGILDIENDLFTESELKGI